MSNFFPSDGADEIGPLCVFSGVFFTVPSLSWCPTLLDFLYLDFLISRRNRVSNFKSI